MKYAEGTSVPVLKSRVEIEMLLRKAGAFRFAVAEEPGTSSVFFELANRKVMFRCAMPTLGGVHSEMKKTEKWRYRDPPEGEIRKKKEGIERERWRALLLAIKSKFVSVETGVETFDEAFLPHIVIKGGTVGEHVLRQLDEAARGGGSLLQLGPGA